MLFDYKFRLYRCSLPHAILKVGIFVTLTARASAWFSIRCEPWAPFARNALLVLFLVLLLRRRWVRSAFLSHHHCAMLLETIFSSKLTAVASPS